MRLAQTNVVNPHKMAPELEHQLKSIVAEMEVGEVATAANEALAKRAVPEAFKEHQFKKKDAPLEDAPEMEREGKETTARAKKVLFTRESQFSPEAYEDAVAKGDEGLAQGILSARHASRVAAGNRAAAKAADKMNKSASNKNRANIRMRVIANAEVVDAAKQKLASASTPKVATASKNESSDAAFKSLADMNARERSAWARTASTLFPAEYVAAALAQPAIASVSEEAQAIRDVIASKELGDSTKKIAVAGLVKTANLSDADRSHLTSYWKEFYGTDSETDSWIDDLFSTKYDK